MTRFHDNLRSELQELARFQKVPQEAFDHAERADEDEYPCMTISEIADEIIAEVSFF